MVAVLVVGGGLGWLGYQARVQREAVRAIEAAGADVEYNWAAKNSARFRNDEPPWPVWLVRLLGRDYFGHPIAVSSWGGPHQVDDDTLYHVGRLAGLECLEVPSCKRITDDGLAHLRGVDRMKMITLFRTGVKGPGLKYLAGMKGLKSLCILGIDANGAELAFLESLTSLKSLELSAENLTDEDLAILKGAHQPQTAVHRRGSRDKRRPGSSPQDAGSREPGNQSHASGKP